MDKNESKPNELQRIELEPIDLNTPTTDLMKHISEDVQSIAKMEIELAKAEARADMSAEIDLAKGAAVAAVCALLGVNMLIVSAVFAMAPEYAWLAALIIGVVLLAVAGGAAYLGWTRAEKHPMGVSRESLKEDLQWAKNQIR